MHEITKFELLTTTLAYECKPVIRYYYSEIAGTSHILFPHCTTRTRWNNGERGLQTWSVDSCSGGAVTGTSINVGLIYLSSLHKSPNNLLNCSKNLSSKLTTTLSFRRVRRVGWEGKLLDVIPPTHTALFPPAKVFLLLMIHTSY